MSYVKKEGFFHLATYDFSKGFTLYVFDKEQTLGEELKGIVKVKSETDFDIEKIWVRLRCTESIAKETAILYEDKVLVFDAIPVTVGFDREFPFIIKLPSVGRETYHSIHQNVQWLLSAHMIITGIEQVVNTEGKCEILVKKPVMSTATPVHIKEIVREVVLIPCAYCSGLMPQTSTFCPNCGARRKA